MKNNVLQGTLVLLCSSVVMRCLGFVYQMLTVRYAGTESLGILNMTMPFYMMLVVLATMGMPVAISKLTAELLSHGSHKQVSQMMRTSFVLVLVLSCICLLCALVIMPYVFTLFHTDARVQQCFYVLIPGILIVPFCSIMRGYFQGIQQMQYPSIGQITEQVIRVVCGIILIVWISPRDVLSLAMSLAAAAIVGELGGCFLLFVFYRKSRVRQNNNMQQTELLQPHVAANSRITNHFMLKKLLSLGLPVTGTRLTSTIDMAIEAALVPFCFIAIGYNTSQAASIYGQFSGVAISLITIPTVLTGALATALLPAISGAAASRRQVALQQYCQQAISITWMFSLPIIFILYLYGEELGQLLFHIDGLGEMMRWLSFGAIFMYLGQTVVGILQGLGMTRTVFINNFCGSAAKLIGMYYCIRSLAWGSNGIAAGIIIGYGLQCMMHVTALGRQVPLCLPWKAILLPIVNSLIMVMHIQFWESILPQGSVISFLIQMLAAAGGYLLIMVCTGQMKQLFTK